MIAPRETCLWRAASPAAFRRTVARLSVSGAPLDAADTFVVVPTRAAGELLRRTVEDLHLGPSRRVLVPPLYGTRADLYEELHERLPDPPPRLSAHEREVLLAAAAREAERAGSPAPFTRRPAIVAEMLEFYDALRRQLRTRGRFEEYLTEELEHDVELDRGAARMLQQTRFLAAAFQRYETALRSAGAVDEHALRERLLEVSPRRPLRHVVIAVADRVADPHGLWPADYDLLTRLPGLARLDVVATEAQLAAGLLERLDAHLPGAEPRRGDDEDWGRPAIEVPEPGRWVFVARDREEELASVARRIKAERRAGRAVPLDRTAVVVRRPLPYLYLAPAALAGAGVPFDTLDALPLAAEPAAAALDLVFECVASDFSRPAVVALLESPHFRFEADDARVTPAAAAWVNRALAEANYSSGDPARLARLLDERLTDVEPRPNRGQAATTGALRALRRVLAALEPLAAPRPAAVQMADLLAFLRAHAPDAAPGGDAAAGAPVRAAVMATLEALATAYAVHDPTFVAPLPELAAAVRRWLGGQTFAPGPRAGGGVQIVDAATAPFGEFDVVHVLGLVDVDWPDRERRSIFYPAALLRQLGWPDEAERLAAARAAFQDLLHLARVRTVLSTFTLEDDAIVEPSVLIEDASRSGLAVDVRPVDAPARVFAWEALALEPPRPELLPGEAAAWARLRLDRARRDAPRYHGDAGPWVMPRVSVGRVERYQECPFRFFAAEVLGLEEEPDVEEGTTPLERGRFLHELFERFYGEWTRRGGGRIDAGRLDEAERLFEEAAERALAALPPGEAAVERLRLLGSAASEGIARRVFAVEVERPAPVLERLLEFPLDRAFVFVGPGGEPRRIDLRGRIDRIDLLAGGAFRVIDYKSRRAPDPRRALQLPIYGVCATQALDGREGRTWTLDEACYVVFEGRQAVVPLSARGATRADLLARAQERLLETLDRIGAGRFPPQPDDRKRCQVCGFAPVCRKDYVAGSDEPTDVVEASGDE